MSTDARNSDGVPDRAAEEAPSAHGLGLRNLLLAGTVAVFAFAAPPLTAQEQQNPNILVIWGDDIGWYNISAYNLGVMGYQTPNIDRIAREGALFTDWYGQQSCTAGRAAFLTGQSPIRTGLTKVGLPGADLGLKEEDPTIAGLLKNHGYMTGQYGKNHLGDRDEHMPTHHGFDEFFGNLYHLNAEEEPENPDYPKDPAFKERFGPRGVIKSIANPDGNQKIEDTGPLTRKRMETVDEEVTDGALDFIDRAHDADKPFFLWWNSTRMHIWTHLKAASQGMTGIGIYPDGMVEHDGMVGQLLDKLDELGIADNTIVMYSTDNGAEVMSWPDGGTTPFRGEKNTQWEGGYRVPTLIRWPGVIEPGTIYNDVFAHEDMLPTLLAAAGEADIKEKLQEGPLGHGPRLQGPPRRLQPAAVLQGRGAGGAAQGVPVLDRRRRPAALRYDQWKLHFLEQRAHGFDVWEEPFVQLRLPKLFTVRGDPFERADEEGIGYDKWRLERAFALVPAQAFVANWLQSFKEFPPRQKAATFGIDQVMDQLTSGGPGSN